jgi:hypothetical protein
MYVLANELQAELHLSKWQAHSRMAIYVGPSINHASNVGLALNLNTGLVSPVFHAKYDNKFQTVYNNFGAYVPKSRWQVTCGFVKSDTQVISKVHTSEGGNNIVQQISPPVIKQDTSSQLPDNTTISNEDTIPETNITPNASEADAPTTSITSLSPKKRQHGFLFGLSSVWPSSKDGAS